ncbi:hypothetical protein [Arthrobacter mangrovi]|uniref:Uncharacterized protein n=1 Tax=Arthrobacter mangrovi TaxID=2966350 RepID=A0ABQ5MWX5_9MICC|nr:hypothetical protein [Arthrobacter mangrovi]GLB68444.1 hypothetical protein AHIS1636_28860 [Arthrobacter mangrovi]
MAVALIVAGILVVLPTAMYRHSRPRRAGEPFGPIRTVMLSCSVIGLLLVLSGMALFVN